MRFLAYWVCWIVLLFSCSGVPSDVRVLDYAKSEVIPSASGAEWRNDKLFLIGDDSPFLFDLDNNWLITNKFALQPDTLSQRVNYKVKKDFEAMSLLPNSDQTLLILGSGSKIGLRDTALLFDVGQQAIIAKRDFRPIYNKLHQRLSLPDSVRVNIEGLAIGTDFCYMAHRGNAAPPNAIFRFVTNEFLAYVAGKRVEVPDFDFFPLQLPILNGELAGLSGIDIVQNKGLLLCASVEATSSASYDGEVLGSYIAYLAYEHIGTEHIVFKPVLKDGVMRITKIESVAVKDVTDLFIRFIAVSDNDDGTSELFEMEYPF